jgi:hypothetical protein
MFSRHADGSLGVFFNISLVACFFRSFEFSGSAFTTSATLGEFFTLEIGSFALENETEKKKKECCKLFKSY